VQSGLEDVGTTAGIRRQETQQHHHQGQKVRTYDACQGFALRVQIELEVVHLSSLSKASKPLSLR
jgi:hypothetical protein